MFHDVGTLQLFFFPFPKRETKCVCLYLQRSQTNATTTTTTAHDILVNRKRKREGFYSTVALPKKKMPGVPNRDAVSTRTTALKGFERIPTTTRKLGAILLFSLSLSLSLPHPNLPSFFLIPPTKALKCLLIVPK